MEKTFLLGMGAQKSGTTWLHRILTARQDANFGFTKEYHVLDAVYVPECEMFRNRFEKAARIAIRDGYGTYSTGSSKYDVTRMSFIATDQTYFAYFADILTRRRVKLTGDITPTYCSLPRDRLRYVESEFAKRDIVTRPMFLMREPVERLRSLVKMKFRKKEISPSKAEELKAMREMCGSEYDMVRANYEQTILNMDAVFGDNCYIGFYETLFSEDSLRSICEFLQIDYQPVDFAQRFNASPSSNDLTKDELAEFRPTYARQYDFVRDRYGADFISKIWGPGA